MNINIQNVHMKHRCYYLFVSCLLSLHTWYIYPHFDISRVTSYLKIDSSSYLKLYHKNYFLVLYLLWDVFNMTLSKNRKILFRKDLIIHHVVSLYVLFKYINIVPLEWSKFTIVECISLMNYIWRNNKNLLKIYRTCSIFFVRMPLSLWMCFNFYKNNIDFPYFKSLFFMIFYDAYILWKLYFEKKLKN
jgi:hypothetical protein